MRKSLKSSFATSTARAAILGAFALALPGIARADAPAPALDPGPAPAPVVGGGEIVVTATRRSEKARDVPIAVTSISGEKLDVLNSSGLDIRFLSSRTPSLQIESSFGRTFPRFYIRGLGNTDFDPNAAQPVSVVYDDVALESPMLKSFPVFDLQSVEVLRGPQGTLFGRNTPAGVIKLDSARPTDTFGGYGSIEWGSYNTINGEAALNVPLGGGFSSRFSGIVQHRENWVANTNYGQPGNVAPAALEGYTDIAGRAQISYVSPDSSFHALVNIHLRGLEGTPRVFRAGLFQQGSNLFSPGFTPSQASVDGFTGQSMSQWGTNLHLDKHFDGIGTLTSISAFEHARVESTGDIDGGSNYTYPPLGLNNALFPDNTGGVTRPDEYSQELRFVSDEFSGIRVQGGGYAFTQKLTYSEFDYITPYTFRSQDLDQDIEHNDRNTNFGFYASGEYKTGALSLRAGARYSHDSKRDTVSGYSGGLSAKYDTGAMTTALNGNAYPTLAPTTASVKGSDTTWDASATYAVTSKVNLYTRVATGYLGPAIQDRVTFGSIQNVAGKQTTLSAEGGIKGTVLDGAVNFAVDGYWTRTKNMTLTAVGGVGNSAALVTVPRTYGSGAEGEIDIRPLAGMTLSASGSYNFTVMRAGDVAIPPCGSGQCTVTDPLDKFGNALIDGNALPQAPRWVGNVNFHYDWPLANGGKMGFNTDWAYRSSINYFLYTAKEFTGRSLTEGGIKVSYTTPTGLEFALFGRNILNQIRSISAIDFNNLTGMINDPRIWGGSLRKRF
ncbi:TonB-dependent receptor [Novosphingobium sp.]|uniref:TonB-dependent receptor n=1 Tax=Novosphingobium sp. TaxID=1874826 RepID=UPI003D0F7E42